MNLSVAKIVVDLSLDREFDYRIPSDLVSKVSIGSVVTIPFGHTSRRGYVVGLAESSDYPNLKNIAEVAGTQPLLDPPLIELAKWMSDYYAAPFEHAVRTMLPGAVRKASARHRELLWIQLLPSGGHPGIVEKIEKKAPLQAALLNYLRKEKAGFMAEVAKQAGVTTSVCRALEKKGFVRIGLETKMRDPLAGQSFLPTRPHVLNLEQEEALKVIEESFATGSPPVVLIRGVTGSGKTEIYLQAIQQALDAGKGAIMLVPEIALTPQMMERFRGRFGESIAVLHSHLSDGERHDEWHRIHNGDAHIVLGARSALFSPVHNLGIILVDEEHEHTYKQEESPRYHARDVAVMRGKLAGCPVVLGSATPSMESLHNAQRGKYRQVDLLLRVDDQAMPVMRVTDMRKEKDGEGRRSFIGSELKESMERCLHQKEQIILFLNRRGFAPSVICMTCGHVFECKSCSVAMTYHKQSGEMICHVCGSRHPPPKRCPACRDGGEIKRIGLGTQRLEETVQKLFPQAQVARMDSDTTTRKSAYSQLYSDVRSGKIDILIGTQMIAKGLHFPNVTLVGVISADASLHLPDFRAAERTFQLLIQVSGRAGRGDLPGEVILQTFTPQHPVIQKALEGDTDGFIENELQFRKSLKYPPFSHVATVLFKGKQEELVAYVAGQWAQTFQADLGGYCMVGAAAPCYLARVKEQYRYHIVLRTGKILALARYLKTKAKEAAPPKGVTLAVDIDAMSML